MLLIEIMEQLMDASSVGTSPHFPSTTTEGNKRRHQEKGNQNKLRSSPPFFSLFFSFCFLLSVLVLVGFIIIIIIIIIILLFFSDLFDFLRIGYSCEFLQLNWVIGVSTCHRAVGLIAILNGCDWCQHLLITIEIFPALNSPPHPLNLIIYSLKDDGMFFWRKHVGRMRGRKLVDWKLLAHLLIIMRAVSHFSLNNQN